MLRLWGQFGWGKSSLFLLEPGLLHSGVQNREDPKPGEGGGFGALQLLFPNLG